MRSREIGWNNFPIAAAQGEFYGTTVTSERNAVRLRRGEDQIVLLRAAFPWRI